ncbi:LOW QUALITY PROTEIN: hypothetical protein TorRG33x02_140500 [Trema orientale]|uniref:Uncharacterized protein n=1 Tax=Trema orientale TaxID=63057 RepID=A0A2P5EXE2_TREOI|nr:LOW QUALITY PROTEIN: hypothetical protein TorRG33x02_140500 [Trema orientale]
MISEFYSLTWLLLSLIFAKFPRLFISFICYFQVYWLMETWSAHESDIELFESLKIEVMAPRFRMEMLRCPKGEKRVEECESGNFGQIGPAVPLLEYRGAVSKTDWHCGASAVPLSCNMRFSNTRRGACFAAPRRPRPAR